MLQARSDSSYLSERTKEVKKKKRHERADVSVSVSAAGRSDPARSLTQAALCLFRGSSSGWCGWRPVCDRMFDKSATNKSPVHVELTGEEALAL